MLGNYPAVLASLALFCPLPMLPADLSGQWSGAYEFHNTDSEVRYVDLFAILKSHGKGVTGSVGPHEYEQVKLRNGYVDKSAIAFEVDRGRPGITYFQLTLSGNRMTGRARFGQGSEAQTANVILDRVPALTRPSEAEHLNVSVMEQIKSESFQNSKVMDHAFYLTDLYGPRLTGSPNFKLAGDWVVKKLRDFGLQNVAEEAIPNPYPGWQCERFTIRQLDPVFAPLTGVPLTWSTATPGPVTGEAVAVLPTEADARDPKQFFDRFRGRLRGKFLFIDVPQHLSLPVAPMVVRFTDRDLAGLTKAPVPVTPTGSGISTQRPSQPESAAPIELSTSWLNRPQGFAAQFFQFIQEEGAAALVQEGRRLNDAGVIRAMGVRQGLPPSFVMAAEHYNRIIRLLDHSIPVRLELDLSAEFNDSAAGSFNVVGEILGTSKKDEIVMLGAHLDSWTSGTGATDNAAGCAIVIEALRILRTLNLPMSRTVRAAFWGAEETGPIGGSSAYVESHLADLGAHAMKPEYSKLSVYFNLDSGTGKVRGAYLEGFEGARPVVESWLGPLRDMGVSLIGRRISFGSDQAPFVRAGLPVIYLEQDPLDFEKRTNHTNMDVYDRLQSEELKQASAVLAILVYDAAMREERIPRKPLLPFQLRR